MNNYWIIDDDKISTEKFRTEKQIKTWFEGYLRNVYKDDIKRLYVVFLHKRNDKLISYFVFFYGKYSKVQKY